MFRRSAGTFCGHRKRHAYLRKHLLEGEIFSTFPGDSLRTPDVEEFRMNLYEAKNPLLGKGGVAAPSKNIPVLLKGADGVVRSTSEWILTVA